MTIEHTNRYKVVQVAKGFQATRNTTRYATKEGNMQVF